ncbi:MAG: hypothetical protein IKH43_03495 [Bacteroidaceae bacterium]|nr:hypothetical protein [Bacteroidaceae bacterium]
MRENHFDPFGRLRRDWLKMNHFDWLKMHHFDWLKMNESTTVFHDL